MGKRKRKASSQNNDEEGDNEVKKVRKHEQRAKSRIMNMPEKPARVHRCDLSIRHVHPTTTRQCVQRAIDLGYDCVCIDVDIGDAGVLPENSTGGAENGSEKKKKKLAVKLARVPPPHYVDENELDTTMLKAAGRTFRQFTRLTCTMNEPNLVHAFTHNKDVAKYDVIAVRPLSEEVLSTFATKPDAVDILSFDPCAVAKDAAPWLYKGKMLRRAINNGIAVELQYGHALTDSESRALFLANARQLIGITSKCRGVVLTSAAENPLDLRAPYDAVNMLLLVDADRGRVLSTISDNAIAVLQRAQSRRKSTKGIYCVRHESECEAQLISTLRSIEAFKEEMSEEKLDIAIE